MRRVRPMHQKNEEESIKRISSALRILKGLIFITLGLIGLYRCLH